VAFIWLSQALLFLFGIDLERIGLHQLEIRLPKTTLPKLEVTMKTVPPLSCALSRGV